MWKAWKIMSLKLWSIPWTTWVLWHTRLMDFWMQVSVSYLELSLGCLALNRYSFCSVYYHSAYAYWLRLEHHFLYPKKSVYYINLLVTISECRIFNLFPVFFFNLKKMFVGNLRELEHANTSLIVGAFFNNHQH